MNENEIVLFEEGEIRRIWDEDEEKYYFSVVDIISILSESKNPRVYWSQLKRREKQASGQLFTFCKQFKFRAPDGKMRRTDCADVEGVLRLIQSVPSPKAEPFKQWLAMVGHERLQEIQDPELAAQRARELYRAKGYSDEWIEARLQSIATRNELTDEWQGRGVKKGLEYAVLTNEVSKGTFDLTVGEHKKLKQLANQSLRDHMTNMELIFTMLGEASATEVTRSKDAQGFEENKETSRKGGEIAGEARRLVEKRTGSRVVSKRNYLKRPEAKQLLDDDGEADLDA